MMNLKAVTVLFVLCLISGCADKKTEHRDQIRQEAPTVKDDGPIGTFLDPNSVAAVREIKELRTESVSSNNVVKNDIQGLGIQIAKVAEKVQGFGGDLAHLEATINIQNRMEAKVDAMVTANATANLAFKNEMQAEIKASIQSTIKAEIKTEINPHFEASANAEAAFLKKTENTIQTSSAGRDNSVNYFAPDVRAAMDNLTNKLYWSLVACIGAITGLTNIYCALILKLVTASRQRADERTKEAQAKHHQLAEHILHGGINNAKV